MIQLIKSLLNKIGFFQKRSIPQSTPESQCSGDPLDRPASEKSESLPPAERAEGNNRNRRRRRATDREGGNQIAAAQPQVPSWDPALFDVAPVEGQVRFHDFDLPIPVMHAISDLGFQYCTPIQAEILPSTLKGKDATGRAQTGTGKTAAFLITVITHLLGKPLVEKSSKGEPRVLVLAPTRELVLQIAEEARLLSKYTQLTIVSVFGGMDYEKQRRLLAQSKIDIVVATPGRLLDFKRQGDVRLGNVEILIIDEADRMLDMGFIPDVRKIVLATPHKTKRQTLLFSATLTPEVTRLASQWTTDPITVEIQPKQVAVDTVEQIIYIVTREEKYILLYNIITRSNLERVLVFCNRKDETRKLADLFTRYQIDCAVLSGDVRQRARIRTLEDFKAGKIRVLVATDVAGRGIHIEGMAHVINYTLPRDAEDYVHRIGRTGRAGATGTSISFADEEDSFYIPNIETFIGRKLACVQPEEEWMTPPPPPPPAKRKPRATESTGAEGTDKKRRPHSRSGAPRTKRGSGSERPKSGPSERKRPPRGRSKRPPKESANQGQKSEA
ncbi:MAG: ATP-dependent RNA helicase RhlB [Desulfobacteraceae bacterium]|nr:ATP-dependent RNA helicase RhlB [Desulfobacteraceae bacterium]